MFPFIMEGTKSKNSKQRAGGKWPVELHMCKVLEIALVCILKSIESVGWDVCVHMAFYADFCKCLKD